MSRTKHTYLLKRTLVFLAISFLALSLPAQEINLSFSTHPRLNVQDTERQTLLNAIQTNDRARTVYNNAKQSIEGYVERHKTDSTWMPSRLQMFWKTRSTDIFIKGGSYDHAEGQAPAPTVKFPGQRGGVSAHSAPKLEDIMPYMDDPRGLYLQNKTTGQMEWVDISKTANIIEGINNNIMRMGYTSAALYWITGEEKYAKFSFDLFDTYMTGMHYRKEPFDLSHGHHQTLAGLSSFEVIQEVAMLNSLTGMYDFLYTYMRQKAPQKIQAYNDVFKKWADIQIAHGVAFNNWNLMQARNVLNIALVLDDDQTYQDRKGTQYYTNCILNTSSVRQWSLEKVGKEGFDAETGLWNESAGYSLGVLNDFTGFVLFFDKHYNLDLVERLPVLKKAVTAPAQYLFPNGYYASFGDSHYGRLTLAAAYGMIANARKNNKPAQEEAFTHYIKTMQLFYKERGFSVEKGEDGRVAGINTLFDSGEIPELEESVPGSKIDEYATPVFSSPHVSYFALRNGMDPRTGLMAAMSGSKGNHMHANGISMELYGKGYVLGPESGIGTNYFQADYAEYYSQFPAHNTVVVDGISAYPVMKSNHAFEVKSSYPASNVSAAYFPAVSFGELYFSEPETQSEQNRLTSIIRTGDSTGYYIDIFRSKRRDGKDKLHDYIYHNMGQQLLLHDKSGNPLPLQPTEKLSFGGGHLFAYDYFYDKKSITTDKDITAVFKLDVPGKEAVQMNLWMKGEKDREIFSVKSPRSTAIDRMGLPKEIAELPMPTLVARQTGEAWKRPFVAVYEPSASSQTKSIVSIQSLTPVNASNDFVGLMIVNKDGSTQSVFSSANRKKKITFKGKNFTGTYAVVSEKDGGLQYLFLGSGNEISSGGCSLAVKDAGASAALQRQPDGWYVTASAPVILTLPATLLQGKTSITIAAGSKQTNLAGKRTATKSGAVLSFALPPLPLTKISF